MKNSDLEFHFCPVCGSQLVSRIVKLNEPSRLVCSACDFVFYLDPKLAVCTIVEQQERIVLTKRAIEPQKGTWVIPGGYVDRGELIEKAALREIQEECGIQVELTALQGIYSYADQPVAVIVYRATYLTGDLIAGDETLESRLYDPRAIPWHELGFPSTKDALMDYCRFKNIEIRSIE